MTPLVIQIILGIAFFFIINWVGKHSEKEGYRPLSFFVQPDEAPAFNLVFRTLSPVVYIIIIAAVLYSLHLDRLVNNLYLVTIFYAVFRLLINFLDGQLPLINWKVRLTSWLSVPFSWFIYEHIIKTKQHLFPNLDMIGDELWLAVLIFMYSAFNNIKVSTDQNNNRLSQYIKATYSALKQKYDNIIIQKTEDQRMQALIYSIMIYENFNRPRLRRVFENVGFRLRKCKTLGIMQVTTEKLINDFQSVEIGADKILDDYNQAYNEAKKQAEDEKQATKDTEESSNEFSPTDETRDSSLRDGARRQTIENYNPDDSYITEVNSIYQKVTKIYYPDVYDASSYP